MKWFLVLFSKSADLFQIRNNPGPQHKSKVWKQNTWDRGSTDEIHQGHIYTTCVIEAVIMH